MTRQSHYEESLADYSDHLGAIALLKRFRPYLEMIPSMRRPSESVITIPLPIVRIRDAAPAISATEVSIAAGQMVRLPCDVGILMCDPEWKIKTGVEIFVFIHRPQEDFSELLGRWRQTQIWLDKGYEWMMPPRHRHILSEGADETHPLFVTFPETPDRIRRGLRGASLPYVTESIYSVEEEQQESLETLANDEG
ncbi:hypothetical protein H6F88_10715 [Oculatella sp. FACHB-28]|uniref:hypothetical protein n=1 Tax=Cyanophyceae TaxID=3028117 RepID=UPI001684BBA3|nr:MULTISPECIES: hypothetical protein [Cyanophyceae]MBD2000638.1 hypothetical protein [Leptolyngbya sp. FACHB-541]MBD2056479.1 hypothetical protein [Oculatella sp. FACHB-28]MBD2070430.1 hypothetical protein [Leptolyngbya sp. FACHB-671]